jgi:hypothetical protein
MNSVTKYRIKKLAFLEIQLDNMPTAFKRNLNGKQFCFYNFGRNIPNRIIIFCPALPWFCFDCLKKSTVFYADVFLLRTKTILSTLLHSWSFIWCKVPCSCFIDG